MPCCLLELLKAPSRIPADAVHSVAESSSPDPTEASYSPTLLQDASDQVFKMAERPIWEQIGTSFIQLYYQQFDTNREQLGALYTDASCLSWEGQQFQGKASIMEKLMRLPFQKIQHNITSQDHQPAPDNCILSMVVGQLKVDDDPVMGFHQLFVLKNMNDKWVCSNDIFRLALYNFA